MNRRIDEGQLVQLLRQAGTDVELDRNRIMAIVDRAATAAPETRPIRRSVAQLQRPRIQLLALPMAAALAVGMVLVIKGGLEPKSEHIKIVTGRTSTSPSVPDPTATSKLGGASSITAPSQTHQEGPEDAPTAGTTPSSPSQHQPTTGNTSVQVAPVPQGSTFRLPLRTGVGWLLVGSTTDESQPQSHRGGSELGPAQVMGQGQTVEVGPYDLSWTTGAVTTQATRSGTWLTVPGAVHGVTSGIRVPVRVHRLPATITLLTGTIGGGGHITVIAGDSRVTAELPSCTQPICPAVVTIQLGQQSGTSDAIIDLNATGPDSKVGLAAVELD